MIRNSRWIENRIVNQNGQNLGQYLMIKGDGDILSKSNSQMLDNLDSDYLFNSNHKSSVKTTFNQEKMFLNNYLFKRKNDPFIGRLPKLRMDEFRKEKKKLPYISLLPKVNDILDSVDFLIGSAKPVINQNRFSKLKILETKGRIDIKPTQNKNKKIKMNLKFENIISSVPRQIPNLKSNDLQDRQNDQLSPTKMTNKSNIDKTSFIGSISDNSQYLSNNQDSNEVLNKKFYVKDKYNQVNNKITKNNNAIINLPKNVIENPSIFETNKEPNKLKDLSKIFDFPSDISHRSLDDSLVNSNSNNGNLFLRETGTKNIQISYEINSISDSNLQSNFVSKKQLAASDYLRIESIDSLSDESIQNRYDYDHLQKITQRKKLLYDMTSADCKKLEKYDQFNKNHLLHDYYEAIKHRKLNFINDKNYKV